ncbi:MAG: AMIN domain-containing protein, partial [Elusimicrobiota bacterium]
MLKRLLSSVLAALLLLPQAAAPLMAAEQASLDGVEVGPDQVTLHLSRQVKYNSFVTADPPRLVIELVGAEHMPAVKLQNGQGRYLRKVRSGQFQKEPSLIVRIVLDLAKLVGYQAKWNDRDLVVRLQGEAGKDPDLDAAPPAVEAAKPAPPAAKAPTPAPKAPSPPPPPLPAVKAAAAAPAVAAVEPAPKPAAAPAAAAPAPKAVVLESVEVGPDSVSLQLSEQVRFTPTVTANPPRLILELSGVEHRAKAKLQEGQGRFLKKVRSGQFQKTPLLSRIVLDLSKPVGYQAKWEGSRLVLSLQGGAEPAAAAAPPPAPKPAVKTIEVKVSEDAQPPVAVSTPAAAAVQVEAEEEPEAPEPPAKPKKAPAVPAEFSSELGELAAAPETAAAHEEAVARAYAGAGYSGGRRDILASLTSEPITLDFDQTDIRDVLKLVAAKAKVNIIYGSDVSGPISLHLVDVPFREAFMTILQMQGLVADQTAENILRIMTPGTLAKERAVAVNQTRVIKLKYSKAGEMKTAVDAVRQAEGRQGKITVDDGSNSMIVTDTLEGIASLENLLSKLDIRPQQVMIEAKLVEV